MGEIGYVFAQAVVSAGDTLMRGFTTVRDLGGPSFGIKQAIDQGSIPGPRIYPSGAFISQSGGHGDFRMPNEVPRGIAGHLSYGEIVGAAVIADGEAEVLRGAREMLRRGASQLKVMAARTRCWRGQRDGSAGVDAAVGEMTRCRRSAR
jgi:imidazolonepropionase-like amidohydrolase